MSANGGPAFPLPWHPDMGWSPREPGQHGMTLRDHFAGQALAGIVARMPDNQRLPSVEAAGWAYQLADAMLETRKAGPNV